MMPRFKGVLDNVFEIERNAYAMSFPNVTYTDSDIILLSDPATSHYLQGNKAVENETAFKRSYKSIQALVPKLLTGPQEHKYTFSCAMGEEKEAYGYLTIMPLINNALYMECGLKAKKIKENIADAIVIVHNDYEMIKPADKKLEFGQLYVLHDLNFMFLEIFVSNFVPMAIDCNKVRRTKLKTKVVMR